MKFLVKLYLRPGLDVSNFHVLHLGRGDSRLIVNNSTTNNILTIPILCNPNPRNTTTIIQYATNLTETQPTSARETNPTTNLTI